jgi:hypothetical protein
MARVQLVQTATVRHRPRNPNDPNPWLVRAYRDKQLIFWAGYPTKAKALERKERWEAEVVYGFRFDPKVDFCTVKLDVQHKVEP